MYSEIDMQLGWGSKKYMHHYSGENMWKAATCTEHQVENERRMWKWILESIVHIQKFLDLVINVVYSYLCYLSLSPSPGLPCFLWMWRVWDFPVRGLLCLFCFVTVCPDFYLLLWPWRGSFDHLWLHTMTHKHMQLLLLFGEWPRQKLYRNPQLVKSYLRICWLVPYNSPNPPVISKILFHCL